MQITPEDSMTEETTSGSVSLKVRADGRMSGKMTGRNVQIRTNIKAGLVPVGDFDEFEYPVLFGTSVDIPEPILVR